MRPRPSALRALALLLALLALAAPAAAQQTSTVLVEEADAEYAPRFVKGTEPVALEWSLLNLHRTTPWYVSVDVGAARGWTSDVEPNKFVLGPQETRNVTVRMEPGARVPDRVEFAVTFRLVNTDTGEVFTDAREVVLISTASARVLDVFPNPLPPPLDNVYGVFLLNVTFWVLAGLAVTLLGDTVVRIVAARAPSETVRAMVRKLRTPVFLLIFAIGIARSFRILPSKTVVDAAAALFDVLVIAAGALVAYRILSAALDYYAATFAARTTSRLDDVLVPLFRKIGAVIVIVAAVAVVFHRLGVNAGVIFGAAGIVGLVIAFAAQDTLSNFFSGVFLMLDRPFVEGDEIQLETGEITRVDHVGLRSTRLYFGRNHELIVLPNNQLATRRVVNLTRPDRRYRVGITVGVDYRSDPRKVRSVLERVVRSHPDVLVDEEHEIIINFVNFGESSLDFFVLVWVKDLAVRFRVGTELREGILDAFRTEGIDIPFPHRTIVWKEGTVEVSTR